MRSAGVEDACGGDTDKPIRQSTSMCHIRPDDIFLAQRRQQTSSGRRNHGPEVGRSSPYRSSGRARHRTPTPALKPVADDPDVRREPQGGSTSSRCVADCRTLGTASASRGRHTSAPGRSSKRDRERRVPSEREPADNRGPDTVSSVSGLMAATTGVCSSAATRSWCSTSPAAAPHYPCAGNHHTSRRPNPRAHPDRESLPAAIRESGNAMGRLDESKCPRMRSAGNGDLKR